MFKLVGFTAGVALYALAAPASGAQAQPFKAGGVRSKTAPPVSLLEPGLPHQPPAGNPQPMGAPIAQ